MCNRKCVLAERLTVSRANSCQVVSAKNGRKARPARGRRARPAQTDSSPLKKGATAGLSSSASEKLPHNHCWTSQQWHPNAQNPTFSMGR